MAKGNDKDKDQSSDILDKLKGSAGEAKGTLTKEVAREARILLQGAFMRATYLMPYTVAFTKSFSPVQTELIRTFAVHPALYFLYNPVWLVREIRSGKMTLWEFATSVLHEGLHIVYKHQERWEKYQEKVLEPAGEEPSAFRWNLAGDCEINMSLQNLVPIPPRLSRMATAIYSEMKAQGKVGASVVEKKAAQEEARKRAQSQFDLLPPEKKYPIPDWPEKPVSMPRWFWFPENLTPPQPRGKVAEDYYPFTKGEESGPRPPPPPPPPWSGFKPGDRVVDSETGEEGVVVYAGPYSPGPPPEQDVRIIVTNHISEPSRGVEDAKIIGEINKAKESAGTDYGGRS